MYPLLLHAASDHLDDISWLHLQGREAPSPVNWDGAREDGVQPMHLLPVEHAEVDALSVRVAVSCSALSALDHVDRR